MIDKWRALSIRFDRNKADGRTPLWEQISGEEGFGGWPLDQIIRRWNFRAQVDALMVAVMNMTGVRGDRF